MGETADNSDDQLIAEVRLSMTPGVGPRLRANLLVAFGSIEAIFHAGSGDLQTVDGIGPKLANKIVTAPPIAEVEAQIAEAAEQGVLVLTQADDRYPRSLRETPDPPGLLYVHGDLVPEDQLSIGIVGTRHASRYGLQQTERLATALSHAGLTIVSGLARGIDGVAHRAALAASGRTLAVLASGVLSIYPPEHKTLAEEVTKQGAVISEAPLRRPPVSGAFPQRNRIISGLSLGTLVIEAADRSGALITARHAGEQGREVFAVPGPADSRLSRGCHKLINDGAKLVCTVDDILEELGPLIEGIKQPDGTETRNIAELSLNEVEQRVLQAISTSPTEIDDVVVTAAMPVHRVLATISVLEMRRLVRRVSGTLVARV